MNSDFQWRFIGSSRPILASCETVNIRANSYRVAVRSKMQRSGPNLPSTRCIGLAQNLYSSWLGARALMRKRSSVCLRRALQAYKQIRRRQKEGEQIHSSRQREDREAAWYNRAANVAVAR